MLWFTDNFQESERNEFEDLVFYAYHISLSFSLLPQFITYLYCSTLRYSHLIINIPTYTLPLL